MIRNQTHYVGCLLAGAIGDALGYLTEFLMLNEIYRKFGTRGVTNYVGNSNNIGYFTDDTQMTLFTAEGFFNAWQQKQSENYRSFVYEAYLRWLYTQDKSYVERLNTPFDTQNSTLLQEKRLYRRQAAGMTCLRALMSGKCGTTQQPINNSKGGSGVMRVTPVGLLYYQNPEKAFEVAAEVAAITHGHPSGYLAAGALAAILAEIANGSTLENAIQTALQLLQGYKKHEETTKAIQKAIRYYEKFSPNFENVEKVGEGWVAEEALAISLFCALHYKHNTEAAITLAINHSGDTDSTGAITGNLLGLIHGKETLPESWIKQLDMAEIVIEWAEKMYQISHN